ncbi:MAG: hypothetical protein KKH72_10700 [Alphaproteobacteria bacterium]|nr:hypothetical protein [Alphaproteobacteria bacterium]
MRLAIIIPTTNGPVRIERISRLARAPLSQVITADDFVPNAEMAGRYHALIDQAGPLRGLIALGEVRFELCLDKLPEMGRSWELAVVLAHWAMDHGHELVTANADLVVWATGVVRPGREIAEEDYHLDRKRASSAGLLGGFGSNARLLVLLPGTASEAEVGAFRAEFASAEVKSVADVDAGVAALEKAVHSARYLTPAPAASSAAPRGRESPKWGFVAVGILAGLMLAAGAGFHFLSPVPVPDPVVPGVADVPAMDAVPEAETVAEIVAPAGAVAEETPDLETVPPERVEAPEDNPPIAVAEIDTPPETVAEVVPADQGDRVQPEAILAAAPDAGRDTPPVTLAETDPPAEPAAPGADPDDSGASEAPLDGTSQAAPADAADPPAVAEAAPAEANAVPADSEQAAVAAEPEVDKAETSAAQSEPAPPLVLVEHRAPPGGTCMSVLFGSASPMRVARTMENGAFPDSDLDGLCAVSFELSGATAPARLDLPQGFLAHVMASDRVQSISLAGQGSDSFFLIEGGGPVAYEMTLTGTDGSMRNFRHNLVRF